MDASKAPMHEALITRGHVHKADPALRHLVFHPCNVVLRHDHCPPVDVEIWDGGIKRTKTISFVHGGGTGGPLQWERCAFAIVSYEGHERLRKYLWAMSQVFPQVGREALDHYDELVERISRNAH